MSFKPHLRCLFTSDWHLAGMKSILGEQSSIIQLKEIDRVYRYAVAHGIEHIFVPGDLFDTPNVFGTNALSVDDFSVIQLILLLLRYKDVVKTHYIPGNHDFSEVGKTSLDILKAFVDSGLIPGLNIYTSVTVDSDIAPFPIRFLPYPCETVPKEYISDIGHLNLCHIDYPNAISDSGHVIKVSNKQVYQQGINDYTVSGHIHKKQDMPKKDFMYVGSLYQKTFAEEEEKGFYDAIVMPDPTGRIRIKKRFIRQQASWILRDAKVTGETDFDELSKIIASNPKVKYRLCQDNKNGAVHIPADFMYKHDNIVNVKSAASKNKSEYERVLTSQAKQDSSDAECTGTKDVNNIQVDVLYGLPAFLNSCGHNKEEINRAVKMVKKAMSTIDIS